MKRLLFVAFFIFITACVSSPVNLPSDSSVDLGKEFTLLVGQSAIFKNNDLTVTLMGIPHDGRCPLQIECAENGPVTVELSIRSGSNAPNEFSFNTFTDNDGSVPQMDFEGMTTKVEQDGYIVQIKNILPFPQQSMDEIKAGDYQVTLIVTK